MKEKVDEYSVNNWMNESLHMAHKNSHKLLHVHTLLELKRENQSETNTCVSDRNVISVLKRQDFVDLLPALCFSQRALTSPRVAN